MVFYWITSGFKYNTHSSRTICSQWNLQISSNITLLRTSSSLPQVNRAKYTDTGSYSTFVISNGASISNRMNNNNMILLILAAQFHQNSFYNILIIQYVRSTRWEYAQSSSFILYSIYPYSSHTAECIRPYWGLDIYIRCSSIKSNAHVSENALPYISKTTSYPLILWQKQTIPYYMSICMNKKDVCCL